MRRALVLVTDRHATGGRDLVDVVARALDAGLPAVQLRDKDLAGPRAPGTRRAPARATRRRAARSSWSTIASTWRSPSAPTASTSAGGSMPVEVVRSPARAAGADRRLCTHRRPGRGQRRRLRLLRSRVCHASKASFGAPQGVAARGQAAAAARMPVLAIGGVTADRVTDPRHRGAGAAVIRAILAADDAALATRGLLRMLA